MKKFALILVLSSFVPWNVLATTSTARDYLVGFANKVQDVSSRRFENIRVMEEPDSPMACLQIAFKHGGAAYDGVTHGLASFLANVYERGYMGISSSEYQKLLDDHGVSISYNVSMDNMIISMCSLPDEFEFATKTLSSVLAKPKLNPETIEEVRQNMVANIRYRASNDPEAVARDAIHQRLFLGHPYSNIIGGTVDSVKAIDSNILSERIRRTMVTNDALVVAVGKLDVQKLPSLIDKVFLGSMQISIEDPYEEIVDVKPEITSDVTQVKAGSGKVVVDFAQRSHQIKDSKYPAYIVLTTWLGRPDLDSLLMRNAREIGLSYRVGVESLQYKHANVTYGFTIVEEHKEEPMVHLIADALTTAIEKGPNFSQVEAAKAYELSRIAFSLVSCKDRALFLMDLFLNGLSPSDVLVKYDAIERVVEADVRNVAQELLDAHKMSVVVVN